MQIFPYAALIPYVAAMLAYLAGLVVAIFLVVRAKGRAAILAAVGFALLTLVSIGQIVLALPSVSREFYRVGLWLVWVLNCCCSIFDIAAIACLIVAIWQAMSGTGSQDVAQEAVESLEEEMVVDVFEEASEEVASATVKLEGTSGKNLYATRVLEETLEGEILEDTEAESAYTTQVLQDMQEETVEESE
jgi:hypothetical protein